jgi:WD40 repeat protein
VHAMCAVWGRSALVATTLQCGNSTMGFVAKEFRRVVVVVVVVLGVFGGGDGVQPMSVACHPSLALYCSGDVAGNILLWKPSSASVVAQYRCKNVFPSTAGSLAGKESTSNFASSDRVLRVRFSPSGSTVGVVDGKGWLHTWHTARPRTSILSTQVRLSRVSSGSP